MTVQSFLTRLIWLCMLPLAFLAVFLAVGHVRTIQAGIDREAADRTHNLAIAIDRQIEAQIAALRALAASPLLDDPPRLKEFYREALGFRESFGAHVILADTSMQMLFNTRMPFGAELPELPRPRGHAAAPMALATGKPAVSDTFFGPIAREPLVAAAVPVLRDATVRYLLLAIMETRQFQRRIDELALRDGWRIVILDGNSDVIARRPPSDEKGGPTDSTGLRRFEAKLRISPWSVVIEIPPGVYRMPIVSAAVGLATAIFAAVLIGILGGRLAGRRLACSVAALAEPSAPLHASPPAITEIEAVRRRLTDADTARTAAESALRESEARLRNIFEQASDGIYLISADNRYLDVNARGCELLGYTREELLRMSVADVLAPHERPRLAVEPAEMLAGSPHLAEWEHLRKDGSTFPAEVSARRIDDHTYIAIVRDLTERRQAEAALRESEARLRELSRRLLQVEEEERRAIARELHDRIGQNLSALNLNFSIIRSQLPGEFQQRIANRLDDTQKLLDLTARQVRNVMAELRPPALDELGLVAALTHHAREISLRSGIAINVEGTEPSPRLGPTVEIALFRIAQEALNNAVKHARAAHATIAIRAGPGRIALMIEDDGVGFDGTAPHSPHPQGLGVTTMRERAEAIGAEFRVESASGKGTRVIVELPQ